MFKDSKIKRSPKPGEDICIHVISTKDQQKKKVYFKFQKPLKA